MKTPDNSLDRLFQQTLTHAESAPPSAGWAQMEALLDANAPRKRRKVAVWLWAASVLPFLLAGLGFWYFQFQASAPTSTSLTTIKKPSPVVPETQAVPAAPPRADRPEKNNWVSMPRPSNPLTRNSQVLPAAAAPEKPLPKTEYTAAAPQSPPMEPEPVPYSDPKSPSTQMAAATPGPDTTETEIASITIRRGKPLLARLPENTEGEVARLEWRKAVPPVQQNPPSLFAFLGTRNTLSIPSFHNARETVSGLWTPKK